MRKKHHQNQDGFSLLESLISLSVFLLVLFAVYIVLESSQSIYAKGEGRVDAQQGARAAMDQIATLLRNAGYFPENFTTPPAAPALVNPIQVATDSALAVYGDADSTGTSNVFLFCWNEGPDPLRPGRNVQYVRWKKSAFADPTAYNCDQGMILAHARDVEYRSVTLRFTYYDANNNPIPNPPTLPYLLDGQGTGAVPSFLNTTQRGAIRRVVVMLTAMDNVSGQQPQIYVLTSDVRLRNLN